MISSHKPLADDKTVTQVIPTTVVKCQVNMEVPSVYPSPSCETKLSSPYTGSIYKEEDYIYETIRGGKRSPLPTVYDEVYQKSMEKEEKPSNICGGDSETWDSSSTYKFPKHTNYGSWWHFIPLWVKVLTLFLIIGITAGYFDYLAAEWTGDNSDKTQTKVTGALPEPNSTGRTTDSAVIPTNATQADNSTQGTDWNYTSQPWFIDMTTKDYKCAPVRPVDTVIFQPLTRSYDSVCFDKESCQLFIYSYVNNCQKPANFTFYVDNLGNVYSGRSLDCPYLTGQLWVAVFSYDDLKRKSPEAVLVLRNFYQIVAYGREDRYFGENVKEVFLPKCELNPQTYECKYF